mmetsp:Transcript_51766/g.148404  ORF Transcript_51766/g.148404 Transcript_51766/m.148404 type:complete len:281 (-) Transcript_51766:567-1409(-)
MTRETTNEQTLKWWRCRWHSDGRLRSNDTLRSHAPSHYIRLRPFAQTLHGPLASSLGLGGPLGLDWHPLAILADGPNDVLAQVADQPQAPDGDSAPLLEGTAPIAHAAHTGKAAAILAGSLLHEANALLVRVVACERRQLQTPTLNVPGSRCPALLGLHGERKWSGRWCSATEEASGHGGRKVCEIRLQRQALQKAAVLLFERGSEFCTALQKMLRGRPLELPGVVVLANLMWSLARTVAGRHCVRASCAEQHSYCWRGSAPSSLVQGEEAVHNAPDSSF